MNGNIILSILSTYHHGVSSRRNYDRRR